MIVDERPLPGDEVEGWQDAPPSYETLVDVPPPPPQVEKAGPSSVVSQAGDLLHLPSNAALSLSGAGKNGAKRPSAWFSFGASSRAAKEVRATVLSLLRDLVKQGDPRSGALGVLESCADACKTYDISLSALLQEQNVEGHTPIYWAIINRPSPAPPPGPEEPEQDLLSAILSHAAPLKDATVDEVRLACLHASDHELFQRLKRLPAFSPLSPTEELIMGSTVVGDDVEVQNIQEDEAAFVAIFRIPMFQRRMRISEAIRLEFIAKDRLWELAFLVVKQGDTRFGHKQPSAGSWVVKLSLLPHSPPTWIDSRLVVDDPRAPDSPVPGVSSPASSGPPTSLLEAIARMSREEVPQAPKAKPPIVLRIRAREKLTAPLTSSSRDDMPMISAISVPLQENRLADGLQFNGCPYLDDDGCLSARLEARLTAPGTECIIC
ncbi:hypothetical protein C8Q80DRAFT_1148406 [Daedaleopsis nitida]|nr:hypothetical protein C8Q80DRAFT_1148406 [Daedaleopsis nitida]